MCAADYPDYDYLADMWEDGGIEVTPYEYSGYSIFQKCGAFVIFYFFLLRDINPALFFAFTGFTVFILAATGIQLLCLPKPVEKIDGEYIQGIEDKFPYHLILPNAAQLLIFLWLVIGSLCLVRCLLGCSTLLYTT
jgi:hypothetical protein